MAGVSRLNSAIRRALEAGRRADRPGTGRGNRGDTPERAQADRQQAAENVRARRNAQEASTTQRSSSINRNRPVSAEDIRQANSAAEFRAMQNRIDEMPEGLRRRTMQRMLDAQRQEFDRMRAAEADRASRRSAQAARDRNAPPVTLPDMPFSKGGMAKKRKGYSKGGMARKGYAKGGYANCGASVPADGKRRK